MATLTWAFNPGDEVRLELPVRPRWVEADPRVDAVRGTVAVERGPVVLCAESVDLPGDRDVEAVVVDPSVPPSERDGEVVVTGALAEPPTGTWPYREPGEAPSHEPAEIPLVPCHSWANRGPSTMRVWLPTS